jgi:hypothetical protein
LNPALVSPIRRASGLLTLISVRNFCLTSIRAIRSFATNVRSEAGRRGVRDHSESAAAAVPTRRCWMMTLRPAAALSRAGQDRELGCCGRSGARLSERTEAVWAPARLCRATPDRSISPGPLLIDNTYRVLARQSQVLSSLQGGQVRIPLRREKSRPAFTSWPPGNEQIVQGVWGDARAWRSNVPTRR